MRIATSILKWITNTVNVVFSSFSKLPRASPHSYRVRVGRKHNCQLCLEKSLTFRLPHAFLRGRTNFLPKCERATNCPPGVISRGRKSWAETSAFCPSVNAQQRSAGVKMTLADTLCLQCGSHLMVLCFSLATSSSFSAHLNWKLYFFHLAYCNERKSSSNNVSLAGWLMV